MLGNAGVVKLTLAADMQIGVTGLALRRARQHAQIFLAERAASPALQLSDCGHDSRILYLSAFLHLIFADYQPLSLYSTTAGGQFDIRAHLHAKNSVVDRNKSRYNPWSCLVNTCSRWLRWRRSA
jgi:hypothetical protein